MVTNDFMIEMNEGISKNKTKSLWNYIKYLVNQLVSFHRRT